jgi:hypothetical protein
VGPATPCLHRIFPERAGHGSTLVVDEVELHYPANVGNNHNFGGAIAQDNRFPSVEIGVSNCDAAARFTSGLVLGVLSSAQGENR